MPDLQKYFKGQPDWIQSLAIDSSGELWFYGCPKSEVRNHGVSFDVDDPTVRSKYSGINLLHLNTSWSESRTNRNENNG